MGFDAVNPEIRKPYANYTNSLVHSSRRDLRLGYPRQLLRKLAGASILMSASSFATELVF